MLDACTPSGAVDAALAALVQVGQDTGAAIAHGIAIGLDAVLARRSA